MPSTHPAPQRSLLPSTDRGSPPTDPHSPAPPRAPTPAAPDPGTRVRERLRAVPRFAIVMAALLAAAAFPQSALFSVQRIDVIGATTLPTETIITLTGLRRGQRLFAVRAAEVASRLRGHPRIKAADVRVQPPSGIVITITERRPVMALVLGNRFALLDDALMVVAVAGGAAGLPEVVDRMGRAAPKVRAGAPALSEGARIALAALAAAPPELRDDVVRIRVAAGPDLTLVTRAGLEIRAGGLSGLTERLTQVPGVLQALRARRVAAAAIDLRYAGSIVVTPVPGGDDR